MAAMRTVFKSSFALIIGTALVAAFCTALMSHLLSDDSSTTPPFPALYSPSFEYSVFASYLPTAKFPKEIERYENEYLATDQRAGMPLRTWHGPKVDGSERVLLEIPDLGRTIYGFTTGFGRACEIVSRFGLACDGGAMQKDPVIWISGAVDAAGPYLIAGLALDSVKRIEVTIGRKTLAASLANNAFYVEIPLRRLSEATALRVTLKNSDVITSDLSSLADVSPPVRNSGTQEK